MDDRSFDRLARALGGASDRRTGLKALVGGILGAGGIAASALDADAKRKGRKDAGPDAGRKKKKRKCDPPCAAGFTCVKGQCTCSGVSCGGACCASGQVCRDGACADPRPTCLPFGEECKNAGRPCCDGLSCASGQDGSYPVACYRSKGAACAGDAECPFGMSCTDGRCLGDGGSVPTGAACAAGETCAQPGATCTAYTTPGAPGGEFCTLPLRKVCTGNPECSCYNCWYVNDGVNVGGRASRAAAPVKACIQPTGGACTSNDDCARGLTCDLGTGTCGAGTQCAPGGAPCGGSVACCQSSTCTGGVCSGGGGGGSKNLGDSCTPSDTCPTGSTCVAYATGSGGNAGTYCLLPDGTASANRTHCVGKALDLDGTCRTCTVYHGTLADDVALAALKTAIETGTANPVYVGTGLYKPLSSTSGTTLISASRGTTAAPLRILACLDADAPARPVIDGGAAVTKTAGGTILNTDNAQDLTWTGGNRIMEIAAGTSGAEKAVEIVGIDFQHGNATDSDEDGGALLVTDYASLTLKSSTVSRCRADSDGGGVATYWEYGYEKGGSATLRGVTITQCSADGDGGAIGHAGLDLRIEGSSTERTNLTYNYAASRGGALFTDGNNETLGSIVDLSWVNVTNNGANSEGGGIECSDLMLNGMQLTDVLIEDNTAIGTNGGGVGGGVFLSNCGYKWTNAYRKTVFTRVTIQDNTSAEAGGIHIFADDETTTATRSAPIELIDSLVTSNTSVNFEGGDGASNGVYSVKGSPYIDLTCTRTAGGSTITGNGTVDCAYDTYYSPTPFTSGCCATTTPCTTAICGGTCCATASTCTGTGTGPYTC